MGFGRFIKKTVLGRLTGGLSDAYEIYDRHKKTGKSLTDSAKDYVKEFYTEDVPGTSHIYQWGRKDGRIQGTAEQAQRDEEKMRKLHEEHEQDREEWNKQRQEYEDTLNEVEKEFNIL